MVINGRVVLMSGECSKPKMAFIDNTPGYLGLDGLLPTLGKDILEFSPDKLMSVIMGSTVDGFAIMPCTENFKNKKQKIPKVLQVRQLSGLTVYFIIYYT